MNVLLLILELLSTVFLGDLATIAFTKDNPRTINNEIIIKNL